MLTILKGHLALFLVWGIATLGGTSDALSAALPDGVRTYDEQPEPHTLLAYETPPNAPIVLLGIVLAVDPTQGTLVLGHGDGTRSSLNTDPALLRKIQVGDPVKVVAEGSTARTLEPLGPFSLQA